MKPTIHQQIAWLQTHIKVMQTMIPTAIADGRLKEEHGTHRLACAQASLETLTQLRGILGVKGGQP